MISFIYFSCINIYKYIMKGGQLYFTSFGFGENSNFIGYFIGFIFIFVGIYSWYQNNKIKPIDTTIESIKEPKLS